MNGHQYHSSRHAIPGANNIMETNDSSDEAPPPSEGTHRFINDRVQSRQHEKTRDSPDSGSDGDRSFDTLVNMVLEQHQQTAPTVAATAPKKARKVAPQKQKEDNQQGSKNFHSIAKVLQVMSQAERQRANRQPGQSSAMIAPDFEHTGMGLEAVSFALRDDDRVAIALMLTSFPFRIFHSTRAFNSIVGHSVVGSSLYDILPQPEGPGMSAKPPSGTSTVLVNNNLVCRTKVFPVLADQSASGLLYYGIVIEEVVEQLPAFHPPEFIVLS